MKIKEAKTGVCITRDKLLYNDSFIDYYIVIWQGNNLVVCKSENSNYEIAIDYVDLSYYEKVDIVDIKQLKAKVKELIQANSQKESEG